MVQNIFIQYFEWHYIEMPREILQGWRNFLEFGLNYFSVTVLARTLFSHWRRYRYDYGSRFDPGRWFEAFTFNLMSRGIGAIMRLFLIGVGIAAETCIFIAGAVIFAGWIFMPVIIAVGFLFGFTLLF